MKSIKFLILMAATTMLTGCGSQKNLASGNPAPQSKNPFGAVYDAPCTDYDTDDYYVGLGIANGARARMDVIQTAALTNAQNIVRQKLQHTYKGAIDDYSNYMGNNSGSDAEAKVERAGTQIINKIVNDTRANCGPKFSEVDEKGDITCFVGIRIYKKEFVDAVTKHLSEDEELKIRFNESEFRKRMEDNFEKFKER